MPKFGLAAIARLADGGRSAQSSAAGAHTGSVNSASTHLKISAGQRVAVATERVEAAEAELSAARQASMTAALHYQTAQQGHGGRHSSTALHSLRLARKAAQEHTEAAAIRLEQTRREFSAALSEFETLCRKAS